MNNTRQLGRYLFYIFAIKFLWSMDVSAQNCPSLLPSNLRDIGETGISWGIELRTFLYGVNKYDEVSQSLQNKDYIFGAADMLVQGEIGDNLFWIGEGIIRHWENRSNLSCQFADEGVYISLKQAFLEWTPTNFLLRVGRQNLAYGNGLVLNHWFDGFELNWEYSKLKGSFFGGALAVDVARACQKKEVVEHLSCWKNLCSSKWGDLSAFGGVLSTRWIGRQRASIMVMHQITSNPGGLNKSASFASLYLHGSLMNVFSYFGELAFQRPVEINTIMDNVWGGSLLIQKLWRTKWGGLENSWGVLYGSGLEKAVFSPLFERVRWGERMHYNAHHGLIIGLKHKWNPSFSNRLQVLLDYFRRLDRNTIVSISDELDFGLMVKMNESKRFWLVYSVLNLTADLARTQQIKFEARIVL